MFNFILRLIVSKMTEEKKFGEYVYVTSSI